MFKKNLFAILILMVFLFTGIKNSHAQIKEFVVTIKRGDKITILCSSRLLPYPDYSGDNVITRVPDGTILIVKEIKETKSGYMGSIIYWFKVEYKQKIGWISIFCTDASVDYKPWEN